MNRNQRNLNLDEIYTNYMEYVRNSNRILNNTVAVLFNQQQTYNNMINSYTTNNSTSYSNIINPLYSRNYTYRPSPLPRYNYIHNRFFVDSNSRSTNVANIRDLINSISYRQYSDIENPTNNTCPISQRDFSDNDIVIMINQCGHIFEPQQIMTWFSRCSLCPLCRTSIITNDNVRNETNEDETNETETNENMNTDNDDLIYRYFSNYNNTQEPTSNLIDQLANIISNEITREQDFSGNIQIEFGLNPR